MFFFFLFVYLHIKIPLSYKNLTPKSISREKKIDYKILNFQRFFSNFYGFLMLIPTGKIEIMRKGSKEGLINLKFGIKTPFTK